MSRMARIAGLAMAALLLLLARPASAQIQAGDLNMNLTGVVSGGYSADYGNQTPSDHSLNFGGTASLAGYFYDPNFLTFTLSPYLNQSRADSNYQSISSASGVNFSSGIFSGSNYPGSINYSRAYNSQGSFAIPGLPSYTTHGNSDSFGINWSENVPDLPSVSVGFQRGSSDYSIYGANDQGNSTFNSFNVHSGYLLDGFSMGAFYQYGNSHSLIPQLFTSSDQPVTTDTDTNAFGFNISHVLPMRGGWSANFTRSSFNNEDQGYSFNGTVDTINTNAGIQPTNKLHLSAGLSYSDNLGGTLYEAATSSGGVVFPTNTNEKSDSLDVLGVASYAFLPNLQALGEVERRDQTFLGESVGATTAGGSILYTRPLLGGSFNVSTTVNDTKLDTMNVNTVGVMATVNYSRRIEKWYFAGAFSYAQNAQTLLVTYTTGYYNYSGERETPIQNSVLERERGRLTDGVDAGVGNGKPQPELFDRAELRTLGKHYGKLCHVERKCGADRGGTGHYAGTHAAAAVELDRSLRRQELRVRAGSFAGAKTHDRRQLLKIQQRYGR